MPSVAIEFACLALATFFGVSAIAKLDAWAFWISAVEVWLPKQVGTRPVATTIPVLELLTSALLVASPTSGLLAAGALLAIFAIGVALIAGKRSGVACGCLGRITSGSIGFRLVLRNAILATVAGALAVAARNLRPEIASPGLPGATIVVLAACLVLLGSAAWATLARPSKGMTEDST
jgi:Methylamine utilisation protein MauE